MADELPIVIGDLNAKIMGDDGGLQALSSNGRILMDLVRNHELDVMNFDEKCQGKWTHVIRTTGQSSLLDYVLTCKQISKTIKEMLIDEDCVYCPFKVTKKKGQEEAKFSDHNAIVLHMELHHESKKSPPPPQIMAPN